MENYSISQVLSQALTFPEQQCDYSYPYNLDGREDNLIRKKETKVAAAAPAFTLSPRRSHTFPE
jgi:hypothetical protein